MKGLVHRSMVLTGARLLGAVATLCLTIILTRQFGAEIAAGFAVSMALAATVATFGQAGFQAFAPILVAEYRETGRFGFLRGFILFSGTVAIALTAVLCIALIWLQELGALTLSGANLAPELLSVTAIIALAMTTIALGGGALTGFDRQHRAQLPDTLMRPLLVLSFVALLAFTASQPELIHVLWLAAIAFAAAAAVVMVFLWRAMQTLPEARSELDVKRWTRMSPSWLGITLVSENMIEVLLLLAATLAGPEEVILLHICFRYRMLTGFGVRSIYSITRPRIHAAVISNETADARSIIGMTNVLCFVYGVAVIAFVTAFSDLLLGVFGPEYIMGKALLICVCSLVIVRAIFGPWISVLGAAGEQLRVALVLGCALGAAVLAGVLLFPALGILAIGVAYTGSNALAAALLWWLALRRTGIDCGIWAVDVRQVRSQLMSEMALIGAVGRRAS